MALPSRTVAALQGLDDGLRYNRPGNALAGGSGYFTVTSDLSSATWNTAAAHEIAVVTGVVRVRIMAEITTTGDDTSGSTATIVVGTETTADLLAGSGTPDDVDTLTAGQLFEFDSAPVSLTGILTSAAIADAVINGADIGYTIGGEAATAGVIVWHVWWEALNATGLVTAGAGGSFA